MKKLALVSTFLKAAMTLHAAGSLTSIQNDFLTVDPDFGFNDRGEMYLRVYNETDGKSAVVEGNISTFSGFVGGTAYLANYVLARLWSATMDIRSLWKGMLGVLQNTNNEVWVRT